MKGCNYDLMYVLKVQFAKYIKALVFYEYHLLNHSNISQFCHTKFVNKLKLEKKDLLVALC